MSIISFTVGILITLLCLFLLSIIAQRRSDRHMGLLHGYWEGNNANNKERNGKLEEQNDLLRDMNAELFKITTALRDIVTLLREGAP